MPSALPTEGCGTRPPSSCDCGAPTVRPAWGGGALASRAAHHLHVSPQACPLPREPISFQSLLLRPVLRLDGATWRALSGVSWRISASVFSPAGCESRPPSRMTGAQGGPQCPVWLPIQWLRHCHPHLDTQCGLKGQRCCPRRTGRVMAIPRAVGCQPRPFSSLPPLCFRACRWHPTETSRGHKLPEHGFVSQSSLWPPAKL